MLIKLAICIVAGLGAGIGTGLAGLSAAAVISPIGELKIDEHVLQLSDGKIGPISQKLYDQLTGIQWGRVPGPEGWSVKVCD